MKNTGLTTKRIGILAALVVLILLLIICITNCGKQTEDVPAPETTEAPQVMAPSQPKPEGALITVPPTTEPTEETTVPTEETVAATTAPTTAPVDSTVTETEAEEDYVDIPDPGSPENPYVEVITEYPADVESVYISANENISYLISGLAGSVLTLEDENVVLTYDGEEYTADPETGAVVLDLSKLGKDPIITLKNVSAATSNCIVKLEEGIGGAGNPEILTDPAEILVELPEEDANGYHYKWTATTDGTVELMLKEAIPEDQIVTAAEEPAEETEPTEPEEEPVILEIVVTVGEESFRLTEKEDGKLSVAVKKNEDILIQVISVPWKNGYYPEIAETVLWTLIPDLGTLENPQPLETLNATIPVTLEAEDADGWHWLWAADRNGQVTLTPSEKVALTVSVDGTAITPAEGEIPFDFRATKGQEVLIQAVAVAEGEEPEQTLPAVTDGSITGTFLPDPGAPENPAVLESIESVTIMLEANDAYGYACSWTTQLEGKLTIGAYPANKNAEITVTAAGKSYALVKDPLVLDLKAEEMITILVKAVADENLVRPALRITLKGVFEAVPGASPENPIAVSAEPGVTSVSMEARQTLYFTGMLHEMMATVEKANGVSIHFDGKTVWGDQTGTAIMEFPEAETEEPVLFSVTTKNARELNLSVGYPEGHAQNPAKLELKENKIQLKENDEDGYLLQWTADCDGFLTVTMEDHGRWQYRIDNLTAAAEGQLHSGGDEVLVTSETLEVKQGDLIQITVKTFDPSNPEAMPAGTLKVMASFFDPLLGTEAKPIRLGNTADMEYSVVVPAGQSVHYTAQTDGMILTFRGSKLMLQHNEIEIAGDSTGAELLCQGADCVFMVTNATDKDQTCSFRFTYPVGHRENPVAMVLGENKAVLEEGNLPGCAFGWIAETAGQLTVTMTEEDGWQFVLYNKTAGVNGIVHTSQDDPKVTSEMLEVAAGDEILVVVNSFDPEHPLHTPAREIAFTADFVDPTLGMEENPVWLNQNGELTIPAGKTMYCTAKVDGMLLTLKGANVKVTHNGEEHLPVQNTVTFLCCGTGTFGHPVFAVTNTGTEDAVYSISFEYPVGHFMNPAELQMGENTAYPCADGKHAFHYLWTADADGILTVTMTAEDNWSYSAANLTTGVVGETYSSADEEIVDCETLEVKKGDQIRIVINVQSPAECTEGVDFQVSVAPAETEESN